MFGSDELLRLAGLLRLGASTAKDIASIRIVSAQEIVTLAEEAENIALRLEEIVEEDGRHHHKPQ